MDQNANSEVYSASEDGKIICWDLEKQEKKWEIKINEGPILFVDINKNGKKIIACSSNEADRSIRIYDRND